MLMSLGSNVEKLMQARGLNYPDVARGIGIDDTQPIWALVKRKSKKSQFAGKLAEFFKIPLERLMAEDFEVGEESRFQDARIKADNNKRAAEGSEAEKLLVVIRTFLDTNSQGRHDILLAVQAVREHRGPTRQQQRRTKRR